MKWIGFAVAVFGGAAFCVFCFLGLMFFEPPIEAPWLLERGAGPGEVHTEKLSRSEYSFEVQGLGPDSPCSLVARGQDGRVVFREASKHAASTGCRGSGTARAGEVWTLEFSPTTPGVSVKAYESHGDGFPHIGAWLLATFLTACSGIVVLIVGLVRGRKTTQG
jgi:hypothetical protein